MQGFFMLSRRINLLIILLCSINSYAAPAADPLPSWNEGPAKSAIQNFVKQTTDKNNPHYVPTGERIATFDQDGTLWVEQPLYTQLLFALDRVESLAKSHPEWKSQEPFKSILAHDKAAMAKFSMQDLEKIIDVTHTGMTTEQFHEIVKNWITTAKNSRWNLKYTDLIYQPMLEVMNLFRSNGFKVYIVTGGGQDFVRAYADKVYGVPPEQVIGSALSIKYGYDNQHKGILMRTPKLLLNNNMSGKPEDIYLFTGRRPQAAFGNSTGDQQMLEYTDNGKGSHLMMLVHHDDAEREYAYGPNSKIGTFSNELMLEAKKRGWNMISMKRDWKKIFPQK